VKKQGGYLKVFAPHKQKSQAVSTLEIFVCEDGRHLVWIWRNELIRPLSTKTCQHIRTVTLSNGKMRVVAQIYLRDISNQEASVIAKGIFSE